MRNIEGLTDWDILYPTNRKSGLSAMVRLRNESEYCIAALNSIAGWCDEIVIALQGAQSDGTDEQVAQWAIGRPNVRIFGYPFLSRPNGPGHDRQARGSVYERAYFYEWALAQTMREYVIKWDGDMIALDWLGPVVRDWIDRGVGNLAFRGHEIVALDPPRLSLESPVTACERRVFRAETAHYRSGTHCEILKSPSETRQLGQPAFLHFKWCKASSTQSWPSNWHETEHFRRIYRRSDPGAEYRGQWPL